MIIHPLSQLTNYSVSIVSTSLEIMLQFFNVGIDASVSRLQPLPKFIKLLLRLLRSLAARLDGDDGLLEVLPGSFRYKFISHIRQGGTGSTRIGHVILELRVVL